MHTANLEYTADGRQMVGYLAADEQQEGPRPAVLVAHAGLGLDAHTKGRAERLATLGYVAFALDYHGGGHPLPNPEAFARLGELMPDPLRTRALGQAGLDVLLAQEWTDPSRVAAIGYCFGGTMVLELARGGAALVAVVGFHPGLATTRPEDARQIKGSVLACVGADDPFCPPEQRRGFEEEMGATDVDWRINLYGGAMHSFTDKGSDHNGIDGAAYHRSTDERSWRAMRDQFDEKFGAGARG
jgi:dienelactone hydrolase